MKKFATLAILFATPAFAHPGHGTAHSAVHAEHVAGMLVVAVVIAWTVNRRRRQE